MEVSLKPIGCNDDGGRDSSAHLRQFDGEMTEQDSLGTLPHLSVGGDLGRLKLVLAEHGHLVDDDPWNTSAKVDDL